MPDRQWGMAIPLANAISILPAMDLNPTAASEPTVIQKTDSKGSAPLSPRDRRKGRLKCVYIGMDDNGNEIRAVDDIEK
jgi:hypothetical protein